MTVLVVIGEMPLRTTVEGNSNSKRMMTTYIYSSWNFKRNLQRHDNSKLRVVLISHTHMQPILSMAYIAVSRKMWFYTSLIPKQNSAYITAFRTESCNTAKSTGNAFNMHPSWHSTLNTMVWGPSSGSKLYIYCLLYGTPVLRNVQCMRHLMERKLVHENYDCDTL